MRFGNSSSAFTTACQVCFESRLGRTRISLVLTKDVSDSAAFNSCAGNDCFSFKGEIPPEAIARSDLELSDLGPWRPRIAVWHHDIDGPPNRSDYMDPEIVRGMIGRGFRLGLYGHQHRTQITPHHIYLPERETMAVVSAGSICNRRRSGPLPQGAITRKPSPPALVVSVTWYQTSPRISSNSPSSRSQISGRCLR